MKKIILLWFISIFIIATTNIQAQITNNGSVPINIIMYNNYVAPANGKSAKGRLNDQGFVVPAGQNVSFIPGTSSVDIYYGNGNIPGIHATVNTNFKYTVSPAADGWILTQDA